MSLEAFLAGPRIWTGTSTLKDPANGVDTPSASSATIAPALHDKFVRIGYTWSYGGTAHEGLIMIAHDPKSAACQLYWGDPFHMGRSIMTLHGTIEAASLSAKGSYAAPPGPDWGWRIDVSATADSLRITMYNITPEGDEDLAVRAEYTQSAG